jgi:hypothetical protein
MDLAFSGQVHGGRSIAFLAFGGVRVIRSEAVLARGMVVLSGTVTSGTNNLLIESGLTA